MKFKMAYFLVAFSLFFGVANPSFAKSMNESKKPTIVHNKNYVTEQLDNETLYEMSMKGELVNNEHTQVVIIIDKESETKLVRITKLLNKTVYSDGQSIENYSVTITGNKEETYTSGSFTVGLTVGFDYEKSSFGTSTAYNATNFYSIPTLLDNRFRLSSLSQTINASGQGYTSTGSAVYVNESNSQGPFSNPLSGYNYSKSTGFTRYVTLNDGSGVGTSATLTYIRIDTGSSYSITFPVGL
jgi:hypothetical protein